VKHFLIDSALVLSVLSFSPTGLIAQGKVDQDLMQIENDWCTAEVKRDATIMGRILADDFTSVNSRGTSSTKSQDLASLKDMTTSVETCVNANMKVRVYGDAAVVTGLVTRGGTYKGVAYKDRQVLFTDTYIRRSGRWQCVATQGTVVAAQQT
jgi:hypothetical protein